MWSQPWPSARTAPPWPAVVGMALSNCGACRAGHCSGEAVTRTRSAAWPFHLMAGCLPVVGVMRRSNSGMPTTAPTSRSCHTLVRCIGSPGAPMEACLPVATLRDLFGCGRSKRQHQPGVCRPLKGIPTGCLVWPLPPTDVPWPAGAGIERSNCGKWRVDACSRRSRGTGTRCIASPGVLMDAPLPAAA